MTLVFPLPAGAPPWPRRLVREASLQRLHAGLLVHADDGGARGWVQVKLGDLRDPLPKLGIRTVHPALHEVGPDLTLAEDALDAAPRDVLGDSAHDRFYSNILDRSHRDPVTSHHRLPRQRDDLQACYRPKLWLVSPTRKILESLQPSAQEARPPAFYQTRSLSNLDGHRLGTPCPFTCKDDTRPSNIPLGAGGGSNQPFELRTLLGFQLHRHRRAATSPVHLRQALHANAPYRRRATMSSGFDGRSSTASFSPAMSGSDN